MTYVLEHPQVHDLFVKVLHDIAIHNHRQIVALASVACQSVKTSPGEWLLLPEGGIKTSPHNSRVNLVASCSPGVSFCRSNLTVTLESN